MPSYTTLQQVRAQRAIQDSATADQDLADLITPASDLIETITGYNFDCRIFTQGFSGEVGALNPTLNLDMWPLLEVIELKNGNGDVVIASNYSPLPLYATPKTHIRLGQGVYWIAPGAPPGSMTAPVFSPMLDVAYAEDAISVKGRWGFHRQFAKAWKRSTVVVGTGGIDSSATALPISGSNLERGSIPKIDVGHVIQVTTGTDVEYMLVTGPVASTAAATSLTVERGYNGSTAIAHLLNDTIDVWQVEPVIAWATAEAIAASYGARQSASGESVEAPNGMKAVTVDLPKRVLDKICIYPYFNPVRGVMPR